jgi:hypothetical protein
VVSNKKITAFSAGTTDKHQAWISFKDTKLTFDEYIDIVSKIYSKMTEEWPDLDFEDFVDDLMGVYEENIREVNEEKIYEMHLENLQSGEIGTYKFQLKNIDRIVDNGQYYSFITHRGVFKISIPDHLDYPDERIMKKEYIKAGAQYLAVDDNLTFASFSRMLDFAIQFDKFGNNHHKDNIINLDDFEKD